ncbi:MAG TPA: alpha/beta hydrolase [Acidimicrobiales bacterium]|nr:alpha/beta hydrolase [Acidimicrobiales bacterium]
MTLRLWPDELEAVRDEARVAVGAMLRGALGAAPPIPPGLSPEARVAEQRARMAAFMPDDTPGVADREIEGVPCRIATPDGPAKAVYVHFHGGGMVSGGARMSDVANRTLAQTHGLVVVSVDYRLAPEHPWPAGPDDGVSVAAWLLDHCDSEWGTDALLVGGESAGAYMAAVVLMAIRDELDAVDRVLGANLVFGLFDWGRSPSARGARSGDAIDLLDPEEIAFYADAFLPGCTDEERRHPTISPVYADLRELPPALLSVGSADHLLDDTLLMATRLAAAGCEVDLFVAPDMPHGFMAFPSAMVDAWEKRTEAWFSRRLAAVEPPLR